MAKPALQLAWCAQQAYASIRAEDGLVYTEVKKAILTRYDIIQETYRQRFRAARKERAGDFYRVGSPAGGPFSQKDCGLCYYRVPFGETNHQTAHEHYASKVAYLEMETGGACEHQSWGHAHFKPHPLIFM